MGGYCGPTLRSDAEKHAKRTELNELPFRARHQAFYPRRPDDGRDFSIYLKIFRGVGPRRPTNCLPVPTLSGGLSRPEDTCATTAGCSPATATENCAALAEAVEVETGRGADALDQRLQLAAALAAARSGKAAVLVASWTYYPATWPSCRGDGAGGACPATIRTTLSATISATSTSGISPGWTVGCQARSRRRRWPERPGFTADCPTQTMSGRCYLW